MSWTQMDTRPSEFEEEKTYWGDRQKRLNKILSKSEAELNRRMKKYYKAEESRVDSLIASYYQKYGENNVIEYRNLLGKLSDKDRELLMRDADAFAQKYPQYSHLVPVRSSIYRLNRLEGMQTSIQIGQAEIGAKTEEAVRKHLEGISGRAYDEIVKMTGPVGVEREDVIRACVGSNWAGGGNFSDRIWKQKDSLVKALNEDLSAGFARGDTYDQMTRMLKQRFFTSYNEAARLVYTEGTYVLNEATARTVEKDFQYYKTSTAADDKVCEICRNASAETGAKPVLFADRQPGFNFPPFHPWCRCSFEIVIPDRQKWIDEYVNSHDSDPALTDEQKQDAAALLERLGIEDSDEAENERIYIHDNGESGEGHVNTALVNTADYHKKYENLSPHKAVNESLYREAMQILSDRNNTTFEDIVATDAKTGERLVKNTTAAQLKLEHQCGFARSEETLLESTGKMYEVLHNHPNSSRLSRDDIKKLFERLHQSASTVCCHNGKLYRIEKIKQINDIADIEKKAYSECMKKYGDVSTELVEIKTSEKMIHNLERKGCLRFISR